MKNNHNVTSILKITFKTNKSYYLYLVLAAIFQTLTNLYGVYSISFIIEYLEKGNFKNNLILIGILIAIYLVLLLLNGFLKRCTEISNERMNDGIMRKIASKLMSISFEYLESPEYIELKKNVNMGIKNMGAIYSFCNSILAIFSNLMSIIALGVIIFKFEPIISAVIIVSLLLVIFVTGLSIKFQTKVYKNLLPINFKYGYYLDSLYNISNAKDFRLYNNVYASVKSHFEEYGNETCKYFSKMYFTMYMFGALQEIIKLISTAFIYVIVGYSTLKNRYSVSYFTLTASAAISLSSCLGLIISNSGEFVRAIEYLSPMIDLLKANDMEDSGKEELKNIETIEFKNVSFTYPHTDKIVLNDISFKINKGEKISIVGLNGAGKTTIVKLICRLYKPTNGEILINNINIDKYSYQSYISLISTVFQDYMLFNYSIKENISDNLDDKSLDNIINEVGLEKAISNLPLGLNSSLGKEYDEEGVDLSGGERQKIAIGRALAKESDLLILDEPTSALDPKAEEEIYENFNKLVKGKTAIYISHRMSSSIFCDKILVLDNGIITDFDSHKNLMKKTDSLYYKLFTTQAKNYQID